MSEVAYAVHTRSCSYLLDDEGVCRWIISPTGMVPLDVRRCVGAQFVACLDPSVSGALVGELVLGANGLFVKQDEETGRMILLRTARIEHVEFRKQIRAEDSGVLEVDSSDVGPYGADPVYPSSLPPPPPAPGRHRMPSLEADAEEGASTERRPYAPSASESPAPPQRGRAQRLSVSSNYDDSFLDPDELVQYDEETTVTLTMPLFRPEAQPHFRAARGRGVGATVQTAHQGVDRAPVPRPMDSDEGSLSTTKNLPIRQPGGPALVTPRSDRQPTKIGPGPPPPKLEEP